MNVKNKRALVDTRNAKSAHYKRTINEIAKSKVCPFCPKTFKWHTKPILKKTPHWLITPNFAPYKNAAHHLLVIGREHHEKIDQLSNKDWIEIATLIRFATKKFKIKGGGIAMRFGDTVYTGATVVHLHLHIFVPIIKNGKAKPVYFPFG